MAQRKLIDLNRVSPLTDFLRNHKAHIAAMKGSGEPDVLTVNGRAEVVVMSAKGFQELLDRLDRAEFEAGVLKGLREVEQGKGIEVREAFRQIDSELDL
jgi:PHD/YefM family antitoxin component YafN of YafNO toxin-antitoxin module